MESCKIGSVQCYVIPESEFPYLLISSVFRNWPQWVCFLNYHHWISYCRQDLGHKSILHSVWGVLAVSILVPYTYVPSTQ